MNKELRFRFGDELLSQTEAIDRMVASASKYKGKQKKLYLDMVWATFNNQKMKNKLSSIYAPTGGVILLLIILAIAFFNPFPTRFQTLVYWIVLSVGAAGAAALIPGFFEIKYQGWLRAGGAMGVLLLMYVKVPAIDSISQTGKQDKIAIYLVNDSTSHDIQLISGSFDKNSSQKVPAFIAKTLGEYGHSISDTAITCYRKSDGKIYLNEPCNMVSELEILVIPNNIVSKFPDKRKAYLKANFLAGDVKNDFN